MRDLRRHLSDVVALLDARRPILETRVHDGTPPNWCEGWARWLLALDDATVARAEAGDPAQVIAARPDAPPDLRALAARVRTVSRVAAYRATTNPGPMRRVSPRKCAQVEALAALAPRGVRRVVDLGAGRGHLTRRLARALNVPALGLERDPAVVRTARAVDPDARARFEVREVDDAIEVSPEDLLVGLHACGALGDALVRRAAATGAAVLLVPCCPQKVPGDVREPLSAGGPTLARPLLGLANLAGAGPPDPRARAARLALRRLLRDAGVPVSPGEEARGLNRRRFSGDAADLAARAFQRRGLPPPSREAVARAEVWAAREHARARRLALPRAMLARPLELAVVLDRAVYLEERGARPEVLEAFDRAVSPRNLAIRAPRRP